MSTDRQAELAESLELVRSQIRDACRAAGRRPEDVRLLAVTKTFPAVDAALLTDLGLTDLAENRDQEANAKAAEVAAMRPEAEVRWHMVGRLQRNKARSVVRWAREVQSVDSIRLGEALAKAVRAARERGERDQSLDVLAQVSLDEEEAAAGRGGCPLPELPALAENLTQSGDLRLRGLMAVAPLGTDPSAAFSRLAAAREKFLDDHPGAVELSAGMSGDLEQAIACGSTCVRVGTALLGRRGLASP